MHTDMKRSNEGRRLHCKYGINELCGFQLFHRRQTQHPQLQYLQEWARTVANLAAMNFT